MSDQRNLFLAIVLSMAVVFGWEYFAGVPKMQEQQAQQQAQQQQTKTAVNRAPQPGAIPAAKSQAKLPRDAALKQAPRAAIETPTLQGSIDLSGARFDDLKLRNYHETPDPGSPAIELLSPSSAEHPYFAEFGWLAPQGSNQPVPGAATKWTLAQGNVLSPGHDVELTYDNGQGLTFTRHIAVDNQYMFTVIDTVDNHGSAPVTLYPYGRVNRANLPPAPHYWVVHEGFIGVFNNAAEYDTYASLGDKNLTKTFDSKGGWLGITDKYWMAALIPPASAEFKATYKAYDENGTKAYQSDYTMKPVTVAPNGSQSIVNHLFAGAKVVDIVNNYATTLGIPRFDLAVDWGWFSFITKPMFLALDFLYRYVGNFGIAILIFTVFVKALFFPLANTSYRAMSKMKKLQPEMERLRERFKDDKVQQQQELMKLYQKERVNPLAGCLPMVIQIPVFFSLYKVLLVTIDMRQAPFFGWIKDLSAQDPSNLFNLFGLLPFDPTLLPGIGHFLVLGAFPMVMGLTMWIQTNLNPPPADPVQQKMFGFMPLLFMFMMAGFPVGLVIYWSWNNFLSILQQVVIMKSTGTPIDIFDRLRGMFWRVRHGQAPEKPAGPPD